MAAKREIAIDGSQVKKAVQALQAFLKSKSSSESLLLSDNEPISLLFTLWKIPKQPQFIRIPLPHSQRQATDEVCLFTRDEPNMTPDQTQRFYKKLLEERGVKSITEIIPYKVLKTEYKPYEAKRRLLGNFDKFLSDSHIRRLLPSHLGKHFYERKKEPQCVNLQSKHLARDIERILQGTSLKVSNRGSCCMARVGHSGMTADEVTDNVVEAVKMVVAKLVMKGPAIKLIHLKSVTSAALPIYTSDLSHLTLLEEAQKAAQMARKEKEGGQKAAKKKKVEMVKQMDSTPEGQKVQEEVEDIPQLVPIETPRKKPKLEVVKRKQREKAPKSITMKKRTKASNKLTKKAGKKDISKVKQKVSKLR
ncbi:ribosomal L1 domain-containing protein 1 [Thalassophryne amazonica]|uniref:ribosomal L1 domain-containing protein 1 n=1 Tax=Thalassophryne amazonica TaxID=390379 RepID=UPI00147178B6|nr:ribosomal L1 domain-containing protein 1 [Thalassophryne amazonica]